MINEYLMAKSFLENDGVKKRNLFHTVYLLVKYFYEENLERLEIREKIFEWAKKYNYFLPFDVNMIINMVFERDKTKLTRNEFVYVTEEEIKEIKTRFTSSKVQLVAFAFLCYSKSHANESGEFSISMDAMAAWLQISRTMLFRKYLVELIGFGYIEKCGIKKYYLAKARTSALKNKANRYKLLVPVSKSNTGEKVDNDILSAFKRLF